MPPSEMEALKEMLRSGRAGDDPVPSRETIRDEWVEAVGKLFDQVEEWLKEIGDEGLLVCSRRDLEREEEELGRYKTSELHISAGEHGVLRLIPHARQVFAGMGRVDAIAGLTKILLLRKRLDEWVIVWRIGPEKNEEALSKDSCAKLVKALLF